MWIIGGDYHPRFQHIAMVNTEGGEYGQRRLEHVGEAEEFYRALAGQGVRVGMETSGPGRWFERLLAELGFELWIGDAAKIRAAAARTQKTDARDAEHILHLLLTGQLEALRIWIPPADERDVRQWVLHRHQLVQMRTRVKNQLRAVALNEGVGRKPGLWSVQGQEQLRARTLPRWTERRRTDNLELLQQFEQRTEPLEQAVEQEAERRPEVARWMTHPGVGKVTALALVLTLGDPTRFERGKQVGSYLGWKRRTWRRGRKRGWDAATAG